MGMVEGVLGCVIKDVAWVCDWQKGVTITLTIGADGVMKRTYLLQRVVEGSYALFALFDQQMDHTSDGQAIVGLLKMEWGGVG